MFRINNDKDIEKFTNHKNTKNLLAKCEKFGLIDEFETKFKKSYGIPEFGYEYDSLDRVAGLYFDCPITEALYWFICVENFYNIKEIHFSKNMILTNKLLENITLNKSFRDLKAISIENSPKEINIELLNRLNKIIRSILYIKTNSDYKEIIPLYMDC